MAKIIEQLTPAATLDGTELVELQQGDLSVKCTTQDIADLGGGGGGASYAVYTALLHQTGTDAPVATVLNSADANYLGDIVWTRLGEGVYNGTLSGAFPQGLTFCFLGTTGGVCYFNRSSDNVLDLITTDETGTQVEDEWLVQAAVEIRVYPS